VCVCVCINFLSSFTLCNTGLIEIIVRVLTTCHTQYTRDRRMKF